MYEYVRELHRQFCRSAECPVERQELASVLDELHGCLDGEEKKLLLRIMDLRDVIDYEVSLESFAAGMRLAAGIGCELGAGEQFSYEQAVWKRMSNQQQ